MKLVCNLFAQREREQTDPVLLWLCGCCLLFAFINHQRSTSCNLFSYSRTSLSFFHVNDNQQSAEASRMRNQATTRKSNQTTDLNGKNPKILCCCIAAFVLSVPPTQ